MIMQRQVSHSSLSEAADLYKHWEDYAPDIPCPISFTEEEWQTHIRDGEGWNKRADFWDAPDRFVSSDWVDVEQNYD